MEVSFNHSQLRFENELWAYNDDSYKHVVFCEGYGLLQNPYFSYLPMQGAKGELLTIHGAEIEEDHIIKSGVFTIPLGENRYRVSATYSWKEKDNVPTAENRADIEDKLQSFMTAPYEVTEHVAGVRPTTGDRRPLVGVHPEHKICMY